jgi:hypothetical protein
LIASNALVHDPGSCGRRGHGRIKDRALFQ